MKAPIFKSALLIAVTALFFSCQKDVSDLSDNSPDSKAAISKNKTDSIVVKGRMETHTTLIPDEGFIMEAGAPAWYPGSGEGNVSHLGKFYVVFNQYAYLVPGVTEMAFGMGAPISDAALAEVQQYVTGELDGISTIWYDKQGNSLILDPKYTYNWDEHNLGGAFVYGIMDIVGGTGKYEGVKGNLVIDGYSQQIEPGKPGANQHFDISGKIIFND